MAKREDVPALWAFRAWQAIEEKSLPVEVLPGTRILRVLPGARIRMTWRKDGTVHHARIRLRSGSYLHPRWITPPTSYEIGGHPIKMSNIRRGLIRAQGEWRFLIYQQVRDLLALRDQIAEHILPKYDYEQDELWGLFDRLDLREVFGLTTAPQALREAIFGRLDQIGVIRVHMAGRLEAVQWRIEYLNRLLNRTQGALMMFLRMIPESSEFPHQGYNLGISESLQHHYDTLAALLKDQPFAHYARWVRYHIHYAQHALQVNDLAKARGHLERAIEHLEPNTEPAENEEG